MFYSVPEVVGMTYLLSMPVFEIQTESKME